MNRKVRRWHKREQRKIKRRLKQVEGGREPRDNGPEMSGNGIV